MNNNKQFYLVDLSGVTDRTSLHQRLQESLPLPSWYGNNLDALYDALTEDPQPMEIRFSAWEEVLEKDPEYFNRFLHVLQDAAAQMPDLEVTFAEDGDNSPSAREQDAAPRSDKTAGSASRGRTLIITDIHGCYDECLELLEKMGFDEENDTLVNLGDTIDRGPKIFETFEYLRGLKERMGSRCILIRGNHEQMMLDAVAEGGRSRDLWYYNSGEKTVFSFLHHKHRIQEFVDWYEDMPFYYVTDTFNCVHASLIDPDPAANAKETLIWGRETDYSGKVVMTGHTPYRVPVYFLGSQYVKISEDVWTVLPETGMIALDTGCVYGNRLTGMVIRPDGTFIVTSVKSGVKK